MVGREEVGFGNIASRCDGWKDGARKRGVGGAGPLSLRSIPEWIVNVTPHIVRIECVAC
jgi:hypothetical protein